VFNILLLLTFIVLAVDESWCAVLGGYGWYGCRWTTGWILTTQN